MKRLRCFPLLVALYACANMGCPAGAAAQAASPYWTGSGGSGMRLGIVVPRSQGLGAGEEYLPAMVQGVLVANISKYSAISVLDRAALDRVIAETLDAAYEDNMDIVRLGHVAQARYMMTGNIIKTSTGYTLQIGVTDTTADANTVASYSGTCTVAELDNHTAIRRASLELLTRMKVELTSAARNELNAASPRQAINAQAALARGITAQRQGTEVAALSYFFQAAAFDPSLLEAASRATAMSAGITSGNIGSDVRNDIQLRRAWIARLTEAEESFNKMIGEAVPPYTLFYSAALEWGAVDYRTETVDLSFPVNLRGAGVWFGPVQKALRAVCDGLDATGRKGEWGLGSWPSQGVTNTNPFARGKVKRYDFSLVFELVNERGRVIGRQAARFSPSFSFSGPDRQGQVSVNYEENAFTTVTFGAVKADDITDSLTVRVASVNGAAPENARFRITALSGPEWEARRSPVVRIEKGVVRGFTGQAVPNLVIPPSDPWGDPVTAIGDRAFEGKGFARVTIPNSVASIGNYAFSGCTSLTGVTIGNGVTYIGYQAFINCYSLTGVTIPGSVTGIGAEAFSNCARLASVTIGNGVVSIGAQAFFRCAGLASVTIPNSVTSIGGSAFSGCARLASVTIGNGVVSIGAQAFFRCAGLASVTVPRGVTGIGGGAFYGCTNLTSVTFQGTISSAKFDAGTLDFPTFPENLRAKYLAGGPGTYTRPNFNATWTKR